jgi:hypothetical protein
MMLTGVLYDSSSRNMSRTESPEERDGNDAQQGKDPAPTAFRKLAPNLERKGCLHTPVPPPPAVTYIARVITTRVRPGTNLANTRRSCQSNGSNIESLGQGRLFSPGVSDEKPQQ